MKLHEIYNPITATPFVQNETYMEFEPCEELKPYIKCFWGSRLPYKERKTDSPVQGIVTPDTCMDIIFTIDFTNNQIYDSFCGIDNQTFVTHSINVEERLVSTFAIRFYAWSAVLFSEESMRDTKNAFFEAGYHFSKLKREIEPLLFDVINIADRIRLAEQFLLSHIHRERENHILMDAVTEILLSKGTMEIGELSREIHTSSRHLERLFRENIGISPKQLSSLVRYQYVWNDVLFQPHFQVLDAVYQYGYTDQSHLLYDFRRFHAMNIVQAKKYALEHVAFLQEQY